jgi:hypothetical protein
MGVSWVVAPLACQTSGMDEARALRVGRLLRILVLVFGLWLAIEAPGFRDPDPEVPRHVLAVPSEHDRGPKGCAPFC